MDEDPSELSDEPDPRSPNSLRCLRGFCVAIAFVCAGLPSGRGFAADGDKPAEGKTVGATSERLAAPRVGYDRQVLAAIDGGVRFLRNRMSSTTGAVGGRGSFPVATTALAGLAILGSGRQVEQVPELLSFVRFLLKSDDGSGYMCEPGGSTADVGSRMHGHCYAVLFLTQVTGSLPLEVDNQVRTAISRGVAVIEKAQSRKGGWYYWAKNREQQDEASVTICAVQALRAAKNIGFAVDSRRIKDGIKYVGACQADDGSVAYSLSLQQRNTTYSLTAAAVSTLNAAGVYRESLSEDNGRVLRKGLDYLRKELDGFKRRPLNAVKEQFFYYGNLYAAQAFYQQGEPLWGRWYPKARARLLSSLMRSAGLDRDQKEMLRWRTPDGDCRYGDEYATAMALLILEVPLGYLPIFQK